MIPGRASAAFIPNFPSSNAKPLSFDLTHPFKPFSSLGGGSPPPPDAVAAPHLAIMLQQVDLLYMPSDTLYGSKYKYILAGIDAVSRYKIARPLRTKQARDVAEMIADIYKVGPLKYPKIFQCDNGSEFKGKVAKMLEKNEVKIRRVTMKYKHTHTAFVEALNKILAERLFKVQDAQELNDPRKYHQGLLSIFMD